MYHFIYPSKDAHIISDNTADNHKMPNPTEEKNFGGEKNLILRKEFDASTAVLSPITVSRVLLHFNLNELSQSIVSNKIPDDATYHLRLYERKSSELSAKYELRAYQLFDSPGKHVLYSRWADGTGTSEQSRNSRDGVSWRKLNESFDKTKWYIPSMTSSILGNKAMTDITAPLASAFPWLGSGGMPFSSSFGGGAWYNEEGLKGQNGFASDICGVGSQSFSYESPDVNMEVTTMVGRWLDNTRGNNGMIVKWYDKQEDTTTETGNMEFYSYNAQSIYSPKLEVRWDESTYSTNLNTLTIDRSKDIYLYMLNLRKTYKENELPKFRVSGRERIQTKIVSTTKSLNNALVLPNNKAWYSITDVITGEVLVPFGNHSKLSADNRSSYFKQDLRGFINNRTYRIKFKLQMSDGKYKIFDDGFEFRVVR